MTRMPEPESVLVIAPNWLGDAVMALPALADIRRRFPTARLVVAARPAVAPLFDRVPGIDEVVPLDWRGAWFDPGAWAVDVRSLRRLRAGLAILFTNSFSTAWLVRCAGIPDRAGYAGDLRSPLLTHAIARPGGSLHQGTRYQHLVHALGIQNGPLEPHVVPSEAACRIARELLAVRGVPEGAAFVVLAPGAAYGSAKRWWPSHYAALLDRLVRASGVPGVLVGSAADRGTAGEIVAQLSPDVRAHVTDLTGVTSLDELAAVLSLARACVANDSGAMHLAGAVGTPVVAVFGPTREAETAPRGPAGVARRVLVHEVACRPCMKRECPIDHPCMRDLAPGRVYDAVMDVSGLPVDSHHAGVAR